MLLYIRRSLELLSTCACLYLTGELYWSKAIRQIKSPLGLYEIREETLKVDAFTAAIALSEGYFSALTKR